MSDTATRGAILKRIRNAVGASVDDHDRNRISETRIKKHPPNLIPERATTRGKSRLDLFTRMLEGQSAKVSHARSVEEVPAIVADYLRHNNLPGEFRTGSDDLIAEVPWDKAPSLTRRLGRCEAGDAVALSRAQTAAAETGTLFLTSGENNPTTLNFLPDNHIVLIRKNDIFGSYEDAWNLLREEYGDGVLPRTVNLVSGPSRTADIEQIIVMGAHGPRHLHVIVIG